MSGTSGSDGLHNGNDLVFGELGFTNGDLLRGDNQYVGRSLKVNGSDFRDAYTNIAALATHNAGKPDERKVTARQSKYLNNLVEQDQRNIERRIRLMLGFKSFRRANDTGRH